MIMRMISIVLAIGMLLCMMPATALATEIADSGLTDEAGNAQFTGTPPSVDYRIIEIVEGEATATEIAAFARTASRSFNNQAPADVDTVEEKVDWIADQCRAAGKTDQWDIALWLHDWLIYNANYDYTYTYYHANGVLLMGKGVCQSYAEAYQLLLNEFSIENQIVSSYEMNHAWNLVKINGQWCHVDCTWDDPNEGGFENHEYFGLDDALMSRDHVWPTSRYPACTSKENVYYVHTGSNVAFSAEEMELLFHKLLSAKTPEFECYYMGSDPDYNLFMAYNEWENTYRWKYGISWTYLMGSPSYIRVEVEYSEPWEKPDDFEENHTHSYTSTVTAPTCAEQGYTSYTCLCGDSYVDNFVEATGNHSYTDYKDTTCNVCGYTRQVKPGLVPVYRLYNPYTQEHLLTSGEAEKTHLLSIGWSLDGVAWNAPEEGAPVYRLYNPYDDWHTYTTSQEEMELMVAAGWTVDGAVSCSAAKENGRPIYRLFNPYVKTNFHLFTAGEDEKNLLVNAGWILEGVAWSAVK